MGHSQRGLEGVSWVPGILGLPHTSREAEHLGALVPEARIYARFEANLANTRDLASYRMIHFATHGFYDVADPELSGIQLSTRDRNGAPIDGILRSYAWEPGSLRADLVTLSACETGRVRAYRTEGPWGTSTALLGAGATRVLVSLWPVDDAATAMLMRTFYSQLIEAGSAPDEA